MKAKVVYFKAFVEDEFRNRVSAQVKYNGKNYVCTCTCGHWFDKGQYVVKYIDSFNYLTTVKRKSTDRDFAIKRAMEEIRYSL